MRKRKTKTKRVKIVRRHGHAPGTAPGTLVSHPDAQPTSIRLMAWGPDEIIEQEVTFIDQIKNVLGKWPVVWVIVEGLMDVDTINKLGELFSLHPLIMEDILNVHQRPKVEEYDQNLFIVSRGAQLIHDQLETEQISFVLGEGFVVSFQEIPSKRFNPVHQRIHKKLSGRIRFSKSDYLMYALLDTVIDSYFPVLERFSEDLDIYEDKVVLNPDREMIDCIHGVKGDLLHLRRMVWPMRDAVNALTRENEKIADETRVFLRDCYDHVVQIIDILESHKERSSDLINIYLSSISNKMNEIMKVLTIIATIFMPIGVVAGIYGMNFDKEKSPFNMPELGWYLGYPFSLGLMLIIALGFLLFFKRKGWLDGSDPSKKTDRNSKT